MEFTFNDWCFFSGWYDEISTAKYLIMRVTKSGEEELCKQEIEDLEVTLRWAEQFENNYRETKITRNENIEGNDVLRDIENARIALHLKYTEEDRVGLRKSPIEAI